MSKHSPSYDEYASGAWRELFDAYWTRDRRSPCNDRESHWCAELCAEWWEAEEKNAPENSPVNGREEGHVKGHRISACRLSRSLPTPAL